MWRVGNGVPAPGLGQNNDAYIDLASGLEYFKTGGAWGQVIQPTLPATKITGQIVDGQIATISGSKITGTIPHGALPAINIDTDTTGQLPYTRLSGAPAVTKITTSAWSGGPPASPANTDIWIATAVYGTRKRWMFQYDSAEATYKWKFIGGPKFGAFNGGGFQNSVANTWQARGISAAVGRAGYYEIEAGATIETTNTGDTVYFGIGVSAGGIPSPYTYKIEGNDAGGAAYHVAAIGIDSEAGGTAWAAGDSITTFMQSNVPGNTAIAFPWFKFSPIAII